MNITLSSANRAEPGRLAEQLRVIPGHDPDRLDDVAVTLACGVRHVFADRLAVRVRSARRARCGPAVALPMTWPIARPIWYTAAGSVIVSTVPWIWTPRRSKYAPPVSTRQLIRGSRARFRAFCEVRYVQNAILPSISV